MKNSFLNADTDIQAVRDFLRQHSSKSIIVDFDEQIQLSTARATMRIWSHANKAVGFAYVDD